MNKSTSRHSSHEQARPKDKKTHIGAFGVNLLQRIEILHRLIIRLHRDATLPIKHDLKDVIGGLSDKANMIPGYESPDETISLGKAVLGVLENDREVVQAIMENQEAVLEEVRTVGVSIDVIEECEGNLDELRERIHVGQREAGYVAAAIGEVQEIWGKASAKEKEAYFEGMSRRTGKRKRGWRCGIM